MCLIVPRFSRTESVRPHYCLHIIEEIKWHVRVMHGRILTEMRVRKLTWVGPAVRVKRAVKSEGVVKCLVEEERGTKFVESK